MKKLVLLGMAALVLTFAAAPAFAEVQNVRVGGSIQVRGHYLDSGTDGPNDDFYSQRTRVNVDAELTGNVRGFVELQAYDVWGVELETEVEDDLIAPINAAGALYGSGEDQVVLYQAYIEMNEAFDMPLRVRVGRQEMTYGREWLVGNKDAGVNFGGEAFDAIRLTYDTEDFVVDAWTAKLADSHSGTLEEDGDIDFYGIYGTWKGVPDAVVDAYWLYVRSAEGSIALQTETTEMHTLGARVAGTSLDGLLDYNVEAAFQSGDNGFGTDFEGLAFNALVGYTAEDVEWTPRLSAEYAFFSGMDATETDTETFLRLFSDVHYGEMNLGGTFDLAATNLHIIRVGAETQPTEQLALKADLLYFQLDEDEGGVFGMSQGLASPDDNVGTELDIVASYDYTEDLNIRLGWAHFFVDDALENARGGDSSDIDYVYIQAKLTF